VTSNLGWRGACGLIPACLAASDQNTSCPARAANGAAAGCAGWWRWQWLPARSGFGGSTSARRKLFTRPRPRPVAVAAKPQVQPLTVARQSPADFPRPVRDVLEAQIALARRGISPGSIDAATWLADARGDFRFSGDGKIAADRNARRGHAREADARRAVLDDLHRDDERPRAAATARQNVAGQIAANRAGF
jgi:hypothetical protein